MMSTEAQARITINKLLEEAGWRFAPDENGNRATIVCEHRVSGQSFLANEPLGNDFEHAPNGFVDYLLLNANQTPIAVVEAKRERIDPLSAKEQARRYAQNLDVHHIFLSNGLVHYYWNLLQGNPVKVSRFLPAEQLGATSIWQPDAARLAAIQVDENYIAVSQDAAWLSYSPSERTTAMINKKIRLLRDYQVNAVKTLQATASATQHRFLFEMATGTGKTLLAAAIAKLYLRTANARRVLFLVDRLELENQAWKNFNAYLAADGISTVICKQKRRDWLKADVVVTTIQSLATRNRFLHEFAPTDFELIISDEAHRTISGNNRAIFEYFVGAKLGLTATPRDYLKGFHDAMGNDPREYERRLLLDTYHVFGCTEGKPTFRYSLLDAVQHVPPYLCNPVTLDARTDITTQMISDDGYTVIVQDEGQEQELTFDHRDFERTFFSDETNLSFVQCFLEHAYRDPITGEIGKTILFAVSRKHATKLVALLNEEATKRWPIEYAAGSIFSVQVTSDVADAQRMTIDFANNNLNGKSRWHAEKFRDYDTSRTRVCVTVGMMTTGYDCEDVLNVVLARPIFSPTDFIQIKGRGTRLYRFAHGEGEAQVVMDKTRFALFDFFANCEYFEEKFNYDQKLTLPKPRDGVGGSGGDHPPFKDYANTSPDPVASLVRETIDEQGMRIDREMYRDRFAQRAAQAVQEDNTLRDAVEAENWPGIEARIKALLFDQPDAGWTFSSIQHAFMTDRLPSLREILARAFGLAPSIPTRYDLAEEAFERYVVTTTAPIIHKRGIGDVFKSYLLDGQQRFLLEQGRFAEIRTHDPNLFVSLQTLARDERQELMQYLQTEVRLEDFEMAPRR